MRTITWKKKRTENLTPVKRQGAIIMLVSFELFVFTKWREASKVWQCNLKYKTSSLSRSTLSSLLYFHTADGAAATSLLSTFQTHELKGSDVAWRGTEWRAVALDTVGGQLMVSSSTETTERESTRAVTILLCLLHPGPCKEMNGDHTTSLPRDRRGEKVLAHAGVSLQLFICLFTTWCYPHCSREGLEVIVLAILY